MRASPEAVCFTPDVIYFGADPMYFDPEDICSTAEANCSTQAAIPRRWEAIFFSAATIRFTPDPNGSGVEANRCAK
jgi:hypothetical protein